MGQQQGSSLPKETPTFRRGGHPNIGAIPATAPLPTLLLPKLALPSVCYSAQASKPHRTSDISNSAVSRQHLPRNVKRTGGTASMGVSRPLSLAGAAPSWALTQRAAYSSTQAIEHS